MCSVFHMNVDVIIIGGGISGLSAAYALEKQGVSYLLFEPSDLGGVVRSLRRDGYTMEQGPNVFIERPHLISLLSELGLQSHIRYPTIERYKQYVWWNGSPHVVPKGPLQFATTALFSLKEKWQIISAARRKGVLKPKAEDESVATFFGRLIGRGGAERVLDPVLKGIYGGEIDELSARSIFPSLWKEAERGSSMLEIMKTKRGIKPKIFTLEGGNALLVEKIVESLPKERVRAERVQSVEREDGRFLIKAETSTAHAREVYIATSGSSTAKYLRVDAELSASLSAINYSPIMVVHVSCSDEVTLPSEGFGVLFSEEESGLLGVMFNSRLFPHMAPEGRHLLTLCFGGAAHREVADCSDVELSQRAKDELVIKLGINESEVMNITRWPAAIPQYALGHHRVITAMERLEEKMLGLHFIGVDKGGVGVPDRVRNGVSLGKSQ